LKWFTAPLSICYDHLSVMQWCCIATIESFVKKSVAQWQWLHDSNRYFLTKDVEEISVALLSVDICRVGKFIRWLFLTIPLKQINNARHYTGPELFVDDDDNNNKNDKKHLNFCWSD